MPTRERSTAKILEQGIGSTSANASMQQAETVDYTKPATAYDVEQW
ncbi:hypothetical protein [Paraburkholderia sp. NMBU_R16]|nr:hypothetical protein [Paraburkholderia sp. NMBU_R16]